MQENIQEEPEESAKDYKADAERGDPIAQHKLGSCYVSGRGGVPKDIKRAIFYFRKAAEQGHLMAQYELAIHYFFGEGVKKDIKEAAFWLKKGAEQEDDDALNFLSKYPYLKREEKRETADFYKKSAEEGNVFAQFNLGECYRLGQGGVKENFDEAIKWYKKAAEQGYLYAKHSLVECYADDDNPKKDLKESTRWYEAIAEEGDKEDLITLAYEYVSGKKVEKNIEKALFYFMKAAEQGQEAAIDKLFSAYSSGQQLGVKKDLKEAFRWFLLIDDREYSDTPELREASKGLKERVFLDRTEGARLARRGEEPYTYNKSRNRKKKTAVIQKR